MTKLTITKYKCDCDQSYCPLEWEGQEVPFDSPESDCFFDATQKPAVSTIGANEEFSQDEKIRALALLYREAIQHEGLDYLQVFRDKFDINKVLWITENREAITLLLPEEY